MQVVWGDAALQGVDGFAESARQDVDERLPEIPKEIKVSIMVIWLDGCKIVLHGWKLQSEKEKKIETLSTCVNLDRRSKMSHKNLAAELNKCLK